MPENEHPTYRLISAVFLRLLGAIYLVAFASIGVQIEGLAGSQGIIPIGERLAEFAGETGFLHYLRAPTLFWLDASDATLTGAAGAGCLAALLIVLNIGQRAALIAAFILYLSLFHAAQPFLNFQWDTLLLESGFLAIFLTPRSRLVIWLFRWLLFRLRFMSGLSKLASGDPAWSGLLALDTYFEVQPLPNPVAWYVHQWPEWILKIGTGGTLFVELVVPFMMFLPRRWRFTAAWLTILWQVLIIATSNHNWINFLTIILCLFLFDDRALQRITPGFLQTRLQPSVPDKKVDRLVPAGIGLLAVAIFAIGTLKILELGGGHRFGGTTGKVLEYATIYSVVNKYHVFPTMTRKRIELEIHGSYNGIDWETYGFRYKPGAPERQPPFVLPHQPRLDWQMWFVTLHPRHLPWFAAFLEALLEGSPAVSDLLAHDPFAGREPPRFLRVETHEYHFTRADERIRTGHWWKRTALGPFTPLPWMERRDPAMR